MVASREVDVVLVGATGFTGRLVASYLARRGGVRVGLAGRSLEKLKEVATETAAVASCSSWDPPLFACALDDATALAKVTSSTRVVLSTAGPYSVCGTPLVAACVATATDYVDINGEVPWVRNVVARYDAEAAARGTILVPNCGYTVLADLGTFDAASRVQSAHGVPASSVRALMQFNGRLSGGTLATGILLDSADEAVQSCRRDPYALGGAPVSGARVSDADPRSAEHDPDLDVWTSPFWMADIDSRVVRRSAGLFRTVSNVGRGCGADGPAPIYHPDFTYRERSLAPDEHSARNLSTPTPPVEKRVRLRERGRLPRPGQGPSEAVRSQSWFRLFFWADAARADGADPKGVLTSIHGADPGYDETSKMCAEAAIMLATRRDELPATRLRRTGEAEGYGGVLTPAFALGRPLVDTLRERGLEFAQLAVVGGDGGTSVADAAATMRTLAARPREKDQG